MSLPINMKFEVPKCKAPPPTRNPLWPPLTPAPKAKVPLHAEKSEDRGSRGPITPVCPVSPKAREGRRAVIFTSPRRERSRGRSLLVKCALPGIPLFAFLTFVNLGCSTEKPQPQGSVLDVSPPAQVAQQPAPAPTPAPAYTGPTYKSPTYKTPSKEPTRVAAKPAAIPAPAPAPAVAEPVVVAPKQRSYVVQQGDTLTSIARAHYGDGNKWRAIASANPNINPDAVRVGQKLVIP